MKGAPIFFEKCTNIFLLHKLLLLLGMHLRADKAERKSGKEEEEIVEKENSSVYQVLPFYILEELAEFAMKIFRDEYINYILDPRTYS